MITAVAKSTKEVVVATGANGREEYFCPDCKQPVYPRRRAKWTKWSVHKKYSECRTKLVASLESEEHKRAKESVTAWLNQSINESSVEIATEKTIATIDGGYRKIDVVLMDGEKIIDAHECQISPICIQGKNGLRARILDCYRLGIPVTWWMGEKANTDTVRKYLLSLTQRQNEDWRLTEMGETILTGYEILPGSNIVLEQAIKELEMKNTEENEISSAYIDSNIPSSIPIFVEKAEEKNILDSLFKYANPQTARLFIKEAIANELDQSPADATSLCAAWEEIQPTLGEAIKPAPSVPDGVTVENPTFATNGNGRH